MEIMQEDFKVYEYEGKHHLAIGEDYKYSATAILTHIMALPSVKVHSKKAWLLTDDYQAEFSYKGNVFVLCKTMDSVDIMPYDSNTSSEIALELYDYIKTFSGISLIKCVGNVFKCLFLPFNYKP